MEAMLPSNNSTPAGRFPMWLALPTSEYSASLTAAGSLDRSCLLGLAGPTSFRLNPTALPLPILDLVAMMALHLRQSRRDRILRGQAAARSLSIRFGRPPIAKAKAEKARTALAAGKGVRQAARLAGISVA